VNTVTGSSAVGAADPPVVGPRFRRPLTVLAALVVLAFLVLIGGVFATRSRLETLSFPESSLALVVGRSMDVRFVVDRQSRWERRLSELLMDDRASELAQSIAWYEEMAAFAREPAVELHLAILEGEAGRRARLREKLEAWDVRPDPYPAMAAVVTAAYLDATAEGRADAPETPDDVIAQVPDAGYPWFAEQLALRLAQRQGDQGRAEAIVAERMERTAPVRRRVRTLASLEIGILGAALFAAGSLLGARGGLRLAGAPLPPPWPGDVGATVLVRGAALQVLLLAGLYLVSQLADSAVLDALTWPWSNLFFLPMLVLARHHLVRPAGLRLRDALGLSLDPGAGYRVPVIVFALVGIGLAGDWTSGTFAARIGKGSHWTEWFDEDLVWGGGGDAALAMLSAVVAAPFFEEVIFRGLLYATFRRRFGVVVSALASALIFAAAHGYGWVGLVSVLWSGVVWAWSYERTRSLVPGMLAHAAVNFLASLSLLLLLR
jgi:membrane protease YdiL (CAAX protease family)